MKRFLLSAALLLACSGVALAQESEFSGGGGGGITAAPGSGTAGRVPQFASTTSLEDSKMTTSGTNKGTWTLYDDTASTGKSALVIRNGPGQAYLDPLLSFKNNAGADVATFKHDTINGGVVLSIMDIRDTAAATFVLGANNPIGLGLGPTVQVRWGSSAPYTGFDIGLVRGGAAGILAITDGSTGQGGIGVSDSATNTVSDALILRHQGGAVNGNGFGTGLLFQGENDGGVMHDMASIDAIYTLDDDTAENTRIEFRVLEAGAETRVASISRTGGLPKIMLYRVDDSTNGEWLEIKGDAGAAQFTIQADSNGTGTDRGIDIIAPGGAGLTLQGAGDYGIRFTEAGVAHRWQIPTGTGHFVPITTNTYDIGTSTLAVKDIYAAGLAVSDAATNTVTDAIALRHATSGTAAASFGTGLLFQGEDAAGNMQDMASIDAVYTDATNGSEDSNIVFKGFNAGAESTWFTMESAGVLSTPGYLYLKFAGQLRFAENGTERWVMTDGMLAPLGSYDLGGSALPVATAYVSTSIQGTRTQAISDNAAAATFVTIAVPTSDTTVGGRIFYTITAIDAGTAIQTKTGTYSFGLNNIGGTVTGGGTDVLEHSQLSAGTLAPTFSVNISGTNAQFQLVLDTSLDAAAETLKIEYRVQIDSGTATVTPAT